MSYWTLIFRSLAYYWRTHLGTALGALLGAAVIAGALFVGDSVKETLHQQALARIGKIEAAILSGDHFVQLASPPLIATPEREALTAATVPVLLLRGSVSRPDGKARIQRAQVAGVDAGFWALSPGGVAPPGAEEGIVLNESAAAQLGVKPGDSLVIRVEKPSAFSRDAPLSGEEEQAIGISAKVAAVVGDAGFGRFSLSASQVPPFSVYLPLKLLQDRLGMGATANLLLSGKLDAVPLKALFSKAWQLPDAGLEVKALPDGGVELRTKRVFFDSVVVAAAHSVSQAPPVEALTYLVNELRSDQKATPYSMVTALGPESGGLIPAGMQDDHIVINQWLAEDLGIAAGAKLTLSYFVMGSRRTLVQQSRDFIVDSILPMDAPHLDSTWMPDFPGLTDKENCREWEPGFDFDAEKIRDKDQQYWNEHRGTPKAFVTLRAGKEMWGNRWGEATSLRWPAPADPGQISAGLRAALSPFPPGYQVSALRQRSLEAADAPVDFGELFLSFSFFLLVAAAVLSGLLFVFSVQQRSQEAGLLLALGLRQRQVRRSMFFEGFLLAVLGSAAGVGGALLYTRLVLSALSSVWRGAVGDVHFLFHPTLASGLTGFLSGVIVAVLAMWLAARRQLKQSVRELLLSSGSDEPAAAPCKRCWGLWLGILFGLAGIGSLASASSGGAEAFFSGGGLLLCSGLSLCAWVLRKLQGGRAALQSPFQLALRNAARKRGRSIATVAVFASGVFMVVSVDAFRSVPEESQERSSGTGGFALVGSSALPVYEDLNTPRGRTLYGIDDAAMAGASVVPARVRDGDDASCLNLNRALQPQILAFPVKELASRGAFRFSSVEQGSAEDPAVAWGLLDSVTDHDSIPAAVDATTLQYALQKKLGDTILYRDGRGQPFTVRIVATLAPSILQGSILISEKQFIRKFPDDGGYRFFLIDAAPQRAETVSEALSRALSDRGIELMPASRKLAAFQQVEDTYLSIFQALGGLGLLLGIAGLAIVAARNALERRREFAILSATGFRLSQLRALVWMEHGGLILSGLVIGALCAAAAVWPRLISRAGGFPFREMGALLLALALSAAFVLWLTALLAIRGRQQSALRNE